jgi:multidrug efflux system membrane fusion protein
MANLPRIVSRIILATAILAALSYAVRVLTRGDRAGASEAGKGPPARAVPVVLAPVEKRDVPIWLEGLGSVTAFQQVSVRPQVDGKLEKVLFQEGQAVRRGQLLAQIDPRPFLVQLHQAEGALKRDRATQKSAGLDLDRYTALRGEKLVAQQQVDDQAAVAGQSAGAIDMDQAQVESARLNLEYTQIKAPLDGVVGVRLVDAGNIVHAADAASTIVVITQLDPVAVFLTAPEDELPRVTAAMRRGEVMCEAFSRDGAARLAVGKLAVVDNQINQSTATLKLKAIMPNGDRALWPNQFVKARVLLDTQAGALVVPAAAVQRGPKGTFVYRVGEDLKAESRDVKVAQISGDLAVLSSGVAAGEQVVVEGANQLRPGTTVQPRGADHAKGGERAAGGKGDHGGGKGDPGQSRP